MSHAGWLWVRRPSEVISRWPPGTRLRMQRQSRRTRKRRSANPQAILAALPLEPTESAKAAGLRYVTDRQSGISREKHGSTFRYIGPDGKPVKDERTLQRIRKLAIPPAYTSVWICPLENGHVQATGRDARGRKQYR